jgi:hypothetical protein
VAKCGKHDGVNPSDGMARAWKRNGEIGLNRYYEEPIWLPGDEI